MRYCKECRQDLPESKFYVSSKGWLSWKCKECCKAYGRAKRTRLLGRPPKHEFIVFEGQKYFLRDSGYYISGVNKRLHRAIWEKQHGPIPAGYHIHHSDGNPGNNKLDNLELVSHATHMKLHADMLIQQELAAGTFDRKKLQARARNRRYREKKRQSNA